MNISLEPGLSGHHCVLALLDVRDQWHTAAEARGDAAGAGVVDQVSFLVMRRYGITRSFTNDRHFLAAGFEALF